MALTKHKLGEFTELYNERCGNPNLTVYDISGVNADKEFFEPSKQAGADTSNYKNVPPDYFACNLMHVGRDKVLPIALNHSGKTKVVSPAYTIFRLKEGTPLLREYFFMMLKSEERDRYFWFHTDSSVRDGMSWDDFCNLEIDIPPLPIQKKYVDVYNAMLANQQSYERGLEDLKLVCDGYIDKLKKKQALMQPLGLFIEKHECKNSDDKYGLSQVRGISNKKEFGQTKADVQGKDLSKFLVIDPGMFAYNPRTDGRDMLVLALNREAESVLVTWNYNAFRIKPDCLQNLDPEYLYLLLCRSEFDRLVRFDSWGSSQELFSWDSLCDVNIPVPSIEMQKALFEINISYIERKHINDHLKERIKSMCPILMKGSLEEAGV